nr:unnamed protein product [Digitaria exilis]CAB3503019.1 unnamed protein product [Digitaria exilis]
MHGCEKLDFVPNFFVATTQFGEAVARNCRPVAEPELRRRRLAGMNNAGRITHGVTPELGRPCFIFHGFTQLCCE